MFNSEKERYDEVKRYNNFLQICEEEKFEPSEEMKAWLFDRGFFSAPASSKYHGAYDGGLYEHSCNVFYRLKDLTNKNRLIWKRPQSPFIVGMFHDLCKCDNYNRVLAPDPLDDITGNHHLPIVRFERNENTLLKGHGAKSIILLSQFITLTDEEILCIRYHMGAYEKDEWQEYDQAIRKYENCLWTHMADMLASKIDEVEQGG